MVWRPHYLHVGQTCGALGWQPRGFGGAVFACWPNFLHCENHVETLFLPVAGVRMDDSTRHLGCGSSVPRRLEKRSLCPYQFHTGSGAPRGLSTIPSLPA